MEACGRRQNCIFKKKKPRNIFMGRQLAQINEQSAKSFGFILDAIIRLDVMMIEF